MNPRSLLKKIASVKRDSRYEWMLNHPNVKRYNGPEPEVDVSVIVEMGISIIYFASEEHATDFLSTFSKKWSDKRHWRKTPRPEFFTVLTKSGDGIFNNPLEVLNFINHAKGEANV